MNAAQLEELVETLLYEGYALYPYTPGTAKNSTPTPFGIVYPPAYAEHNSATHDHLRLECGLVAEEGAPMSATVRFLAASGERHQAAERRIELPAPGEAVPFAFDGLEGRARMRTDPAGDGVLRVRVCVHNTTPFADPEAGRAEALQASLLSTHVIVTAPGSRFLSPIEHREFESLNTFPVLATPEDDTVLGATIVLPDHPQLAPQSRGNLFDGTEIEEALLLHVHALPDMEREAIAEQDPRVRAMVERAAATTPEDLMALHGVMHPTPPGVLSGWHPPADAPARPAKQTEPPVPPADLPHFPGDAEVMVGKDTFRRGDTVRLRPQSKGDPIDHMVDGKTATIEKILHDVDGRLYFAVTVNGDPGQELLRESGRFLFFFEGEVEPV
jgi:hypothetical protein